MSVHAAFIVDAGNGEITKVELDDDLSVGTLFDVEDQWSADRAALRDALAKAGVPKDKWPGSLHWDWGEKSWRLSLSARRADYRVFGLRLKGVWQGTMLTVKDTHVASLPPDAGKPLVYLNFIETAPWNWDVEEVNRRRKYGLVGAALFAAAVGQSYAVGCDGRLGLHSLWQAESFYRGRHMVEVRGREKDGMNYFELTAAAAAKRHGRR